MIDIDRYLNEVCWAMGGSLAAQQTVRDELRAHVADATREYEMQGIAPGDALAAALVDLGEPEPLGRTLRASRGTSPLRRPLVQPAGALIIEPRRVYHRPPAPLLLALAAAGAMTAVVSLAYAWPG